MEGWSPTRCSSQPNKGIFDYDWHEYTELYLLFKRAWKKYNEDRWILRGRVSLFAKLIRSAQYNGDNVPKLAEPIRSPESRARVEKKQGLGIKKSAESLFFIFIIDIFLCNNRNEKNNE